MVNRKDFRPSSSSSTLSEKDRQLIRTHSRNNLTRYNTQRGVAEIYHEKINGKERFFVDVIEGNKIKTLPESENREQAQGKLKAYNNGTWNKEVKVEGDSSVGIPSYKGIITADYGTHYEVKDKDGNYDEILKRFVHTQEELDAQNRYYEKEILPNDISRDKHYNLVYGTGKYSYIVTSHDRYDSHNKSTIIVKADSKEQIREQLRSNNKIEDNIKQE